MSSTVCNFLRLLAPRGRTPQIFWQGAVPLNTAWGVGPKFPATLAPLHPDTMCSSYIG